MNTTRTAIALILAGTWLMASGAAAQVPTGPCPQEIIDWLQDPGLGGQPAGTGEGPNDCETYKHGLGNGFDPAGTRIISRFNPALGSPECGPEQAPRLIQGQMILVEPVDSVCNTDTAPNNTCPVRMPGNAFGPGTDYSYLFIPDRINFGFFFFGGAGIAEIGNVTGIRVDDDGQAGGSTTVSWNHDPRDDDTADATTLNSFSWFLNNVGDPFNPDPNLRTGGVGCCDSIDNAFCAAILLNEYPAFTVPVGNPTPERTDGTDLFFTGNKGTSFRSGSDEPDGQLYGVCEDDRTIPCDLLGTNCPTGNCDFAEIGVRTSSANVRLNVPGEANGTPDPSECATNQTDIRGYAVDAATGRSQFCPILDFYAAGMAGDPQPTCLLLNFGTFTRPDNDCDGVEDDTDGDGQPGPDLCPTLSEQRWFDDANDDGIGDECQCGDASGDGAITGIDIGATAICANDGTACDSTQADADGDVATTGLDIAGVVALVNGNIQTSDLKCARNP